MTKFELVRRLAAANPHLLRSEVEAIVDTIFGEMAEALARGDRVELRGFGAFTGRNPGTGDSVQVAEKHVPFFRAGKPLNDRLNQLRHPEFAAMEPPGDPSMDVARMRGTKRRR